MLFSTSLSSRYYNIYANSIVMINNRKTNKNVIYGNNMQRYFNNILNV